MCLVSLIFFFTLNDISHNPCIDQRMTANRLYLMEKQIWTYQLYSNSAAVLKKIGQPGMSLLSGVWEG
ncbi:hypothetical protein GLYMA_17G232250v4 [Glycine max]|nr:hypothetical protein GLYMA_17G232250v4 [Glycine max]KAH1119779.1 hypothetical protein GYH30_048232 [Glycine max]